MEPNIKLETKLFKIILIITVIASIFNIIANIIIGFPINVNFKWIFILIISLISIKFINSITILKYLKTLYFLNILFVLIPIGWFESGGSNNNTLAYIFLVMICITFFFDGKLRKLLISILIMNFIILFSLEYFYPELVNTFSEKSQFIDRLIQIPITLIGGYLLIKQFSDAYTKEKEMLDKYSKELEIVATKDALTGVYNRRMFDFKIKEIFANKQKCSIYLILIDIDYFKRINDTYGHMIGDKAICELVKITQLIMPKNSIISRWGGDEFSVIFFGDLKILELYMNKLYNKLRKTKIEEKTNITISSGITLIKNNDDINEIFKRADIALYESKEKGKNRYTIK